MAGERTETCAAAAGSLLLEFATLSRLTDEPIYEEVARKAFYAIWNSRSHLDLVGNSIDARTGHWIYPVASVGAGIDSLYEYMLKSYILLGEDEYYRVWDHAYKAVQRHLRSAEGLWVYPSDFMTFCGGPSYGLLIGILVPQRKYGHWRYDQSIRGFTFSFLAR